MDHHQQKPQGEEQLPMCNTMPATTTPPSSPPLAQQSSSSPQKSSTSPLGVVEEFVIGCLSGIVGAALSCCQLSGWSFVLCVILLPFLGLELVESYILFDLASSSQLQAHSKAASAQRVVARKRLARQLFGQGVIMGSAGLHITASAAALPWQQPQQHHPNYRLVFYATLWILWMILCNIANQAPLEDKVAGPVRRRHATRRTASTTTRSRAEGKGLQRTSSSSSSSPNIASRYSSSRRNSSKKCCVPVELP